MPTGFGLKEGLTPLDDYQQSQMVKKLIERAFPDATMKELNPYAILDKIGYHQARGIGFRVEYTDEVHERAQVEYAGLRAMETDELTIWEMYEKNKVLQNSLDFNDMILLHNRRCREDEAWRTKLQKQFDFVLCDEVQDHSKIQWEYTSNLLTPENLNLYCVGDFSQSVMGFQGAAPQLLLEFSKGWRGTVPTMYRIATNHRSLPKIISLANSVQAKMDDGIPLKMLPFRGSDTEKGVTRILKGRLPIDIATSIATEIHRNREVTPYRDNAILVRTATQIRDIETALVRYRIPYIVRGGKGLLATEEVRDILSYLHFATNPKSFTSFARAMAAPKRGYGEVALERVSKIAEERFDGDLLTTIAPDAKLIPFITLIKDVQRLKDNPVDAVMRIINGSQYKPYIEAKYKKDREKVQTKLENLERFGELVGSLVEDNTMTTEDIVFQLTLDRGREDDKDGSVVISTVHSSKGLEWKNVWVPNMVEDSYPHFFSKEHEVAEERRLVYVAFTRARDKLIIGVHEFQPPSWGEQSKPRPVEPSRFLKELNII
jgi:DNA helicase-2/ATP-dependent DNA helicase PcrA